MSHPHGIQLALALCAGVAVTSASLPLWRSLFRRRRWVDDPGGRKVHSGSIALAGGAAVFGGVLAGFWVVLSGIGPGLGVVTGADHWIPVLLAGSLAMLLLGWWDDICELRPAGKFGGQLLVATATVALGVRLPFFPELPLVQMAASVLFILVTVNAMNFLDNMNGLCAGLGAIAYLQLAVAAWQIQQPALAAVALAAAGACAGFLPYNFPNASVFLGDAGSHVIGYLLGTLSIQVWAVDGGAAQAAPRAFAILLVLAVPLLDITQVVAGRALGGRPVHVADTNHVSHRLVRVGFGPAGAVLVLWGIAAALGALGVALATRGR